MKRIFFMMVAIFFFSPIVGFASPCSVSLGTESIGQVSFDQLAQLEADSRALMGRYSRDGREPRLEAVALLQEEINATIDKVLSEGSVDPEVVNELQARFTAIKSNSASSVDHQNLVAVSAEEQIVNEIIQKRMTDIQTMRGRTLHVIFTQNVINKIFLTRDPKDKEAGFKFLKAIQRDVIGGSTGLKGIRYIASSNDVLEVKINGQGFHQRLFGYFSDKNVLYLVRFEDHVQHDSEQYYVRIADAVRKARD